MKWVGHKHPVWKHFYFAEEDEDEQKEVAKVLKELEVYDGNSVKNRKKEDRKTSLEAAFKEPNTQPQEGKID